MFTDITQQFEHIKKRIEEAPVLTDPWPHMFITEVFTPDFYRTVCEFDKFDGFDITKEHGRIQHTYNEFNKEYEQFTSNLFSLLSAKFEFHTDALVPATTNFWEDTHLLSIDDVHVDAFYDTLFTISGQVYLPVDINQKEYGTAMYRYTGNNLSEDALQDEGTAHPHIATNLDNFKLVRRLPFYPNCMFVTTNNKDSWHRAPDIAEGDVRKSLMWRWKV